MSYQPPSYPQENAPTPGYPGGYPPIPGYPAPAPGQAPQPYPPVTSPYPGQAPPMGYPPQQALPPPQAPYGYAPQPPYAPAGQPYPQRRAPVRTNELAVRSLLFGGLALVATIVAAFFGYVLVGGLSIFPVIYGVMGLVRALRLPGRPGMLFAIGGIVLGGIALLLTIFFYIG